MSTRREQLDQLDKATLIEQHLLLEKRVETLERQLSELKRALGIAVRKTPRNSSIPPGQAPKANLKPGKKAKRGPKKGHAGRSRRRQEPDEVIACRVQCCRCCGLELAHLLQHEAARHQVLDIPPMRPIVREVVRYGRYCPACGSYQWAECPQGYEHGRVVGPHLEGLVLYLHAAHPLSYQRVQTLLRELSGVELGIGTLVNIVKRGQAVLRQGAAAIRQRLQQAPVVGSDETGARVAGHNQWQWVFQTPHWAYYVVRPSRGAQVITEVLGSARPSAWVSDAYSAQMKHPAQAYQLCLAHQIRDLQYLIDTHQCEWATQMQALFRRAIHLHKARDTLSMRRFDLYAQAYRWRLDRLLQQEPSSEDGQRLWRRFHKHRAALLFFLERADVPPTNNASEQALRNSVIYRKVTGGFRTNWGAEVYANLLSVLESARRQRQSAIEILTSLFTPTPHFSWIGE